MPQPCGRFEKARHLKQSPSQAKPPVASLDATRCHFYTAAPALLPKATMSAPPAKHSLPIDAVLEEIRQALATRHELVLEAPPGAGKTTGVPLALLSESWLRGRILILEPRRMAARAAAARMA